MDTSSAGTPQLKDKYAFGSLYLTYIPLNDIRHLLDEKEKVSTLTAKGHSGESLSTLKSFLDKQRGQPISEGVAFVQLDMETARAGYKLISDRDGSISTIAWSTEQVRNIAKFADDFLNSLHVFEEQRVTISSGSISIGDAYDVFERLNSNPYIPSVRTAGLVHDFRAFVAGRESDLDALRQIPKKYNAIIDLVKRYDGMVDVVDKEPKLSPLRSKGAELAEASRVVADLMQEYGYIIGTQEVQDCLKLTLKSSNLLGKSKVVQGYFIADSVEVLQNMMGGVSTAPTVTVQPFGKYIASTENIRVGSGKFPGGKL
jgi:hypothetical protein